MKSKMTTPGILRGEGSVRILTVLLSLLFGACGSGGAASGSAEQEYQNLQGSGAVTADIKAAPESIERQGKLEFSVNFRSTKVVLVDLKIHIAKPDGSAAYDLTKDSVKLAPSHPISVGEALPAEKTDLTGDYSIQVNVIHSGTQKVLVTSTQKLFSVTDSSEKGLSVSLTAPASGTTVSGKVTLSAKGSSEVKNIEFFQGAYPGTYIGRASLSGTNGSFEWDSTSVANGSIELFAKAWSSPPGGDGAETHSSSITLVVNNKNVNPSDPIMTARSHLDSWGVNLDANGDAVAIADRLNLIGVRRIRAHMVRGGNSNLSYWQAMQNAMVSKGYIKPKVKLIDLIVAYNNDPTSWDNQKAPILQAAASGILTEIEGPNEMNNRMAGNGTHGVNNRTDMSDQWSGPNGNVQQWAQAIHSWKVGLQGNDAAVMEHVSIVSPTIASGDRNAYAALPNISNLVDYGNLHFYAGYGKQPNVGFGSDNPNVGYFANMYRWSQSHMSPGKSIVLTEVGATTHGAEYSLHAQAAYVLNQIHDAAGIGAKGVFIYCMIDPNTGTSDPQDNFGIFNTNLSPKPAAVVMSYLKHLLSLNNNYDDPANANDTAPFTPGYDGTKLSVSGIGAAGFSSRVSDAVVFPKSDGSTLISVTNQATLCDENARDLTPTPVTATVNFGSSQSWHVYDVFGAKPLSPIASGTGSSMQVTLRGYPMYIVLDAPAGYHR